MVSIHLEHIIAKKNGKILKNMVSRAKKRHFVAFLPFTQNAIYALPIFLKVFFLCQ